METSKKPTVLFFHAAPDELSRVRSAFALSGIRVREAAAWEETLPLRVLLESESTRQISPQGNRESAAAFTIPETMAVIDAAQEAMLDYVLSVLRQAGMGKAIKAVVTPVNETWNARQLYTELCMERSAIAAKKKKQ